MALHVEGVISGEEVLVGAQIEAFVEGLPETQWTYKDVPIGRINVCSQLRDKRNEVQEDLEASIHRGMIYPVSVTVLPEALFADYIEFTNHTWRSDQKIEDFTLSDSEGRFYMLLIAGHSRLLAISSILEESGEDPIEHSIEVRYHQMSSLTEILNLQKDENIHSRPSKDRAARAIAEAYLWEKRRNPNITKKAFIESQGKGITREFLNDVISYVNLPPKIRSMTDNGALPFSVSVELSRALDPITNEGKILLGIELLDGEDEVLLEEYVTLELQRHISWFNNNKRNIGTTRARIRNHADSLREKHQVKKMKIEELSFEFVDTNPFTDHVQYLRKQVADLLQDFQATNNRDAARLHQLSLELLDDTELAVDEALTESAQLLGGLALLSVQ